MVGLDLASRSPAMLAVFFACACSADPDGGGDDAAVRDAQVDAHAVEAGPPDAGSEADADAAPDVPRCETGTRDGPPGDTDGESTPRGVEYIVRTPGDYDPTLASPLVVVYSQANVSSPVETEDFTGLTPEARDRGYVIAYADHVSPTDLDVISDLGRVPGLVASRWCIDESRIYLTGHSDGGSVATLVPLLDPDPVPAAIAPSAAGVSRELLDQEPCATELPVMVMHSADDQLFPVADGFGAEAAAWWAACAGCDPRPSDPIDGCIVYTGCDADLEVRYCEGDERHGRWPGLNESIFDFFDRFARS